ncbi:DUF2634 domain-containing protein [Paenibacillus sp. SN-8-1]|uniref:DUF2634 domain-containing protein n=1 Tax=Paenibacillus sp. SN-8-1 TaxID=3435409 RepID=UPI003D9A5B8E
MADETTGFFPDLALEGMEDIQLESTAVSEDKWTYMIDFRNRRAVLDDSGRPRKTRTYEEYLMQTALKILNTERFQYVVYDEDVGVEKSEWSNWEDNEIKRDIEEALVAHPEIQAAEVLYLDREPPEMHLKIRLTGLAGAVDLEEAVVL